MSSEKGDLCGEKAVQVSLFSGSQRYMMLRRESVKYPESEVHSFCKIKK